MGLRRLVQRLLSSFRSGRAERDLAREIEAHLRLLEDEFIAKGVSAADARYAAKRAFGGVAQVKEHHRDARSFRWLAGWPMDLKLGARMLIKYPGLTLVGGLGMAVGIAVGATSFAFLYASLHPNLPLDEGDRVVGLENWDETWNDQELRSLHDFVMWRDELKSVQDLAAFQPISRNLFQPNAPAVPVQVAEMTASGFRVARVSPLFGRYLIEDDEQPGAPPVAVIGHGVWRMRFSSDPDVVGQTLRLGSATFTVIGVMPPGFAFPVNQSVWVPLLMDRSEYRPRRGPEIVMFGRLAPGVTLGGAQAELTTIGLRSSAAFPGTHQHLRPRVVRYTELWFDDEPRSAVHGVQLVVTLLLVVVCVNISALVYARTATRQTEIAVRTALGASRGRIVAQLFVEAIVLSGVAAAAGLALAGLALSQASVATEQFAARFGGLPFWMTFGMSAGTVGYVLALTILGGVIVGVAPALKATGSRAQPGLQHLAEHAGPRLGRTWTTLIVVQVAFAFAVLPGAVFRTAQSISLIGRGPGFAADQFLAARVVMDRDIPWSAQSEGYEREYVSRYANRITDLVSRLETEPRVSAATVSSMEPGLESTVFVEIETESPAAGRASGEVRLSYVDAGYFEAFDVSVLAGRPFGSGDLHTASSGIIVNRRFVDQFLGHDNPLGRLVRHRVQTSGGGLVNAREARAFEIVGVVDDFPARPIVPGETTARLYHPLAPGASIPARLSIRIRGGTPLAFTERLREITAGVDPMLRLTAVRPLGEVYRQEQMGLHWAALALSIVTLSVLLLSAAGIYALMSVAVTRRRKEIGIRVALGADRGRILRRIFQRAFAQLGIGVVLGLATAALLDLASDGELMGRQGAAILPAVAAFMIAVGVLATVGPARRALRIDPIEALKAE